MVVWKLMIAILVGDLMFFTGDGKFCFGVITREA